MKKYYEKFLVWQLFYRKEIVCFIAGFIIGVVIL
jgi:hypothetical protein